MISSGMTTRPPRKPAGGSLDRSPSTNTYANTQKLSRKDRTFHNPIGERNLRTMATRHENAVGGRRLKLNERAA